MNRDLDFKLPPKTVLEAAVERTTTCKKCGGGVIAMCADIEVSDLATHDLDILTTLYCRNPQCGWSVGQWRHWRQSQPEVL